MNKKTIRKAIASYEKIIRIHKEKINREEMKELPNLNLIEYWKKEIQSLENNEKKLKSKI
ncbi:MAG: hypothetical protein AABX84_03255 [Nanoarchaeota archaeon]